MAPRRDLTQPRTGLGEKPALASAWCTAQTVLAQATPTPGPGGVVPNLINRCASHNDTLAYRCMPLSRIHKYSLEMVLVPLWRYAASQSQATRSRWQWTWVGDDSVCKKYGAQSGRVGTWWSGQEHRVLSGIDGVLLVVVIGEGKLVVPVDFAIRRPDPQGPGAPCRDKLRWVQGMLDGRVAAFRRHGVALPPPMVV